MSIKNKDILNCFPLLASILGDKYGVTVHVGGNKAMTDGNIIYLPSLPIELDDENIQIAKGYVDHEAAHIRHTDFELLRKAGLNKLESWLFNAIEDWRVEKKMSEIYPGCEHNFRRLILKIFGEKTETRCNNLVSVFMKYVLLIVRSWAVPEAFPEEYAQFLIKNYSKLKNELDVILQDISINCISTADAIDYARNLTKLLQHYAQKEENISNNKSIQNSYNRNNSNPTGSNNNQLSSNTNTTKPTPNINETISSNASKPLQKKEGVNSCQDNKLQEQTWRLEKTEDFLPQNLGEILANRLSNMAQPDNDGSIIMAKIGNKLCKEFPQEYKEKALRNSVAMRHRLTGLLQSQICSDGGLGRTGKLVTTRLYRLAIGNTKIFRHMEEKRGFDTAVHILLDCSASMSGENIVLANQACFAIVKILTHIKGVNLGFTAFPAEDSEESVYPVIQQGRSAGKLEWLGAFGTTPLGSAIWWVIKNMVNLKEKRRIILVISDGVPTTIKPVKMALDQCNKLAIEVMGIGIKSHAISYLMPKKSKTIWNIQELAPAMFELMEEALVRGGKNAPTK